MCEGWRTVRSWAKWREEDGRLTSRGLRVKLLVCIVSRTGGDTLAPVSGGKCQRQLPALSRCETVSSSFNSRTRWGW